MATLTAEELNGLRMGIIDLYRQYCPEKAFDDRAYLLRKKKAEYKAKLQREKDLSNVRWSVASSDSSDSNGALSVHKDIQSFNYNYPNTSHSEPTVSDAEVAEYKQKRLAIEDEARKASTYKKLEMLPSTPTDKSKSRDRLIEKRSSRDYSLFERIGLHVNKILGMDRPKNIQYTENVNEIPLAPTFSEMLLNIMKEKNLENTEVYKKAQIDRRLFSKIISNMFYAPSRETVFCLIIALKLNIEEATDFLATAGFAFRRNNLTDIIVEYFIRFGFYDIFALNEVLKSMGQPLLFR